MALLYKKCSFQCGLHHNLLTTDQIFCICSSFRRNGSTHQLHQTLHLSYEKASCRILTEFGIPMKLVGLNKTFLNETYVLTFIHITFSEFRRPKNIVRDWY